MENKTFNRLLTFSLFFLLLWFFGNLYEEILLASNHVQNAYKKLQYWHGFFTEINQIYYYVPFTQLAVVVLFILYKKSIDNSEKLVLKNAIIFGSFALSLTALIITQLNVKLYLGNNLDKYKDQLQTLSIIWLIGNAVRLYLVARTILYVGQIFIRRQMQVLYAKNYR